VLDAAMQPLVESAVSLLTSAKLERLRRCGKSTCYWLFIDETRNHSRRWCENGELRERRQGAPPPREGAQRRALKSGRAAQTGRPQAGQRGGAVRPLHRLQDLDRLLILARKMVGVPQLELRVSSRLKAFASRIPFSISARPCSGLPSRT